MGTVKVSQLSDAEIIARYRGGEGRTMIALRAKMPDRHVREVLEAAGVPVRGRAEARVLFVPSAVAQQRRQRERRRGRRVCG